MKNSWTLPEFVPSRDLAFDSLLLGASPGPHVPLGFHPTVSKRPDKHEWMHYKSDAHLVTVAPTRAGKGTGVIIPNLLTYRGPVVVFDPKGENYWITARRRRDLGQRVVKIDPFSVVDKSTDALNPLDVFQLDNADLESDAQWLAELLSRGTAGLKEPFWDIQASSLHAGLIAHAASQVIPSAATLANVIGRLMADDVVYNLAVLLDTCESSLNEMAKRELAAFLQLPDITRGGVLGTATSYIKAFHSVSAMRTLGPSSFSLQDVVEGNPLSIYVIIPPDRLVSHRALLKLWIGTLIKAVFSRRHRPALRTLFLLDEAAQLETFPLLESMMTIGGGYGTWVWTFWQDLEQMQKCYPDSWRTILNNCGVVQAFGFNNRDAAQQWGRYLDTSVQQLRNLSPDDQVLAIYRQGEQRCERLNYLRDERFLSLCDRNRFYLPRTEEWPQPELCLPSIPMSDVRLPEQSSVNTR